MGKVAEVVVKNWCPFQVGPASEDAEPSSGDLRGNFEEVDGYPKVG